MAAASAVEALSVLMDELLFRLRGAMAAMDAVLILVVVGAAVVLRLEVALKFEVVLQTALPCVMLKLAPLSGYTVPL